jgi:FkbM family methyltransferase
VHRNLNKPHYVFRPGQLVRRLAATAQSYGADETAVVGLARGGVIECWPDDAIGSSLVRTGTYDLLATEALMRLVDTGELAVDAGANIGHMTSALAQAAGPRGRVVSFEPHPDVFAVLARNVERWRRDPAMAAIEPRRCGLSDRHGRATMEIPAGFTRNRGTSRVMSANAAATTAAGLEIAVTRLDESVTGRVGVLKLDVEGHEVAVLDGSHGLLAEGAVRDIVFEEHRRYPTELTRRLEARGFHVRGVLQQLRGPRLIAPGTLREHGSWDPPVLIATRDPARVASRFSRGGWRALRRRPRGARLTSIPTRSSTSRHESDG